MLINFPIEKLAVYYHDKSIIITKIVIISPNADRLSYVFFDFINQQKVHILDGPINLHSIPYCRPPRHKPPQRYIAIQTIALTGSSPLAGGGL